MARESGHARLMVQWVHLSESTSVDLDSMDEYLADYRRAWTELWTFFPDSDLGLIAFPDRSPETAELACWTWQGQLNKYGYATSPECFSIHRRMYEIFFNDFEKLGPDFQAHHRCENKRCINPHHLESLTEDEHRAVHGIEEDWE